MRTLYIFILCFFASVGCKRHQPVPLPNDNTFLHQDAMVPGEQTHQTSKEALLLTRFTSLEDFKEVVQVRYEGGTSSTSGLGKKAKVILSYRCGVMEVTSILAAGISQGDYLKVRKGNFWDRVLLGLRSPYTVLQRDNLAIIENLGRRRPWIYGRGDVAFYDLAESMVFNISDEDTAGMSAADLSDKGYLNTFNHITAQAFMTSMFSERLADFVADVHELYNMPELISGNFTEAQLSDFVNGPVDNYVDMINNELGQELGKILREKYQINRDTKWTPELLTNFLNDIQGYHSWAFMIGFAPFRATDDKVKRFADKLNMVKTVRQ